MDDMYEVQKLKRQVASLKTLVQSMERVNSKLYGDVERLKGFEATVESERQANAALTEELDKANALVEDLRTRYITLQAEIGRLIPPVDGERANDSIIDRVRRYVERR